MNKLPRIIFLALLVLACYQVTFAQSPYSVTSYHTDIQILADASIHIKEKIEVEFNEKRHGIYRNIPLRYQLDSADYRIVIRDVSVEKWQTKVYQENGQQVIRIGDADRYVEGHQEYHISYTVKNGLLWLGDKPELFWDVVGDNWEVPIQNATYRIQLPTGITKRNTVTRLFTGEAGQQESNATLEWGNGELAGQALKDIEPGEAISIAVLLPEGYIEKPVPPVNGWRNSWLLTVPGLLFGLLLYLWNLFGVNREKIHIDGFVSYPPENISAAEAGVIIDQRANTRDILALLPDWGNKGYIQMTKLKGDVLGSDEIMIEKLQQLPEDTPDYEQTFFNGLFKKSDMIMMSELQSRMVSPLYKSIQQLQKYCRNLDMYDAQAYKRFHSGNMLLLSLMLFISSVLSFVLWREFWLGLGLVIISLIVFIFHFLPKKLNQKGLEWKAYLHALKDFLKSPDPDRMLEISKTDANYLSKLLPFAVALGVDKSFLKKMNDYPSLAPAWFYMGAHHNTSNHHMASMQEFTSSYHPEQIQSAFQIQSGSTGSSGGFSGGGSAGGGFGGGGGGSW